MKIMNYYLILLVATLSLGACNSKSADPSATISAQETRISELSPSEKDKETIDNFQESSVNEPSEVAEQAENSTLNDDVVKEPSQENQPNETFDTNQFDLLWYLPKNRVVVSNDKVIVSYEGQWSVVDIESGQVLWMMNNDAQLLSVDSSNLYLLPASQRIDAYSLQTGELVWTALSDEAIKLPLDQVLNLQDYIAINFTQRPVSIAINKSTGDVQEPLPPFRDIYDEVGIVEKLPANDISGYSLDGTLLWAREDVQISANCEAAFVLFNEIGQTLEAIDVHTGETLWSIPHKAGEHFCIRESTDGVYDTHEIAMQLMHPHNIEESQTLFRTNNNTGYFERVDLVNGNVLWEIKEHTGYRWLGEHDGKLIFVSTNFATTKAIDTLTSETIWENGRIVLAEAPKLVEDKLISIVEHEETDEFVALDINSGELIWSVDAGEVASYTVMDQYIAYQPRGTRPNLQIIDIQSGINVAEIVLPGEDLTGFDGADSIEINGLLLAIYGDYVGVIRP